jgi:hypothetical protein
MVLRQRCRQKKDQVVRISLLFPGMRPICITFAVSATFFWLRELVTIDLHLPEIAAESS